MNKAFLDQLGFTVGNDILNDLIGKELGRGSFRTVYELEDNPDRVIKIESGDGHYNIMEWEIWSECPPEQRKWLAPCYRLSPCGCGLVQARVAPVTRRPAKIPDWMDDNKLSNWGKYKGRIVCCDYGHHRFFKNGFRRTRLVNGRSMWRSPLVDI